MAEFVKDPERALVAYCEERAVVTSTPLSREREAELSTRIQQGDLEARDELVEANLRFVIDVAKHYQHRGLSFAELISAGNLGLMTGAERFDGTRGFKFISYAVWWIRQSILLALAEQVRTVRLPINRLTMLKKISTVSNRLEQERAEAPDAETIAAALDVPVKEVVETLASAGAVRSLDEAMWEDDERCLVNVLADPSQKSPDVDVVRESIEEQVEVLLESLDEREQRILHLYYGLNGTEAFTLEQISGLFGVTRERIRQIKQRALIKLRDPSRVRTVQAQERTRSHP